MWKSPIEITVMRELEKAANDYFTGEINNAIMDAVMKIGVSVDKDELVKALKYSKDQYDKGYK